MPTKLHTNPLRCCFYDDWNENAGTKFRRGYPHFFLYALYMPEFFLHIFCVRNMSYVPKYLSMLNFFIPQKLGVLRKFQGHQDIQGTYVRLSTFWRQKSCLSVLVQTTPTAVGFLSHSEIMNIWNNHFEYILLRICQKLLLLFLNLFIQRNKLDTVSGDLLPPC